jgi:hypothetical protein
VHHARASSVVVARVTPRPGLAFASSTRSIADKTTGTAEGAQAASSAPQTFTSGAILISGLIAFASGSHWDVDRRRPRPLLALFRANVGARSA